MQVIKHNRSILTSLFFMLIFTACDSNAPDTVTENNDNPTTANTPAPEPVTPAIAIDGDDIAGVVTSLNGIEAGVWVIAETDDFDTRFAKIVVTDDEGRYLIPDLPDASYQIWVRGYGLADSAKVNASPGTLLSLSAVLAPDRATAAEIFVYDLDRTLGPPQRQGSLSQSVLPCR